MCSRVKRAARGQTYGWLQAQCWGLKPDNRDCFNRDEQVKTIMVQKWALDWFEDHDRLWRMQVRCQEEIASTWTFRFLIQRSTKSRSSEIVRDYAGVHRAHVLGQETRAPLRLWQPASSPALSSELWLTIGSGSLVRELLLGMLEASVAALRALLKPPERRLLMCQRSRNTMHACAGARAYGFLGEQHMRSNLGISHQVLKDLRCSRTRILSWVDTDAV